MSGANGADPATADGFRLSAELWIDVEPTRPGEHEQLEAPEPPRLDARRPDAPPALPAVGWATVDAERLAREWAAQLDRAADDALLGAYAWWVRGTTPTVVLLEPSTEGRLVASLVRHAEGPAALYLPAGSRQGRREATGATPFGRATLVPPAARSGPFVLLVAATDGRVPSPR